MADNYTQFSEMIPCKTKEQQDWLLKELADGVKDDDGGEHPVCEFSADRGDVWVHAEDSGDLDALANAVSFFQLRFKIEEPWTFTWAETCSKPRVSQFGGGGIVVYKGKIHGMNAWDWCTAEAKRLQEEAP